MAHGDSTWRDSRGIATASRWLLWAHASVTTCFATAEWMAGGTDSEEMLITVGLIALLQLCVFVITTIVVLRWFYVATANGLALGADELPSPAMAVGSFFIPFVNLVMPYMTMRDLWKAGARPRDGESDRGRAVVAAWWALWLGAGVAGLIAQLSAGNAEGGPAPSSQLFAAASGACSAGAALCLAWLISRIQEMQAAGRPAAIFE